MWAEEVAGSGKLVEEVITRRSKFQLAADFDSYNFFYLPSYLHVLWSNGILNVQYMHHNATQLVVIYSLHINCVIVELQLASLFYACNQFCFKIAIRVYYYLVAVTLPCCKNYKNTVWVWHKNPVLIGPG